MVQHGLNEGVKNKYKTNAILHMLKRKGMPGVATKWSPKNKISNKKMKMNVRCDRLGRSLASAWADLFFDVHNWDAPVGLLKGSKKMLE